MGTVPFHQRPLPIPFCGVQSEQMLVLSPSEKSSKSQFKLSDKAREGNRRRNKRWRENNLEHVKELNRKKSLRHYYKHRAKVKKAARVRANKRYAARTPEERREITLRPYGLTIETFNVKLAKQGNVCASCGTADPGRRGWMVDHCHNSNKTRGIVCHLCNAGLGYAKDDINMLIKWIAYLKHHEPST